MVKNKYKEAYMARLEERVFLGYFLKLGCYVSSGIFIGVLHRWYISFPIATILVLGGRWMEGRTDLLKEELKQEARNSSQA